MHRTDLLRHPNEFGIAPDAMPGLRSLIAWRDGHTLIEHFRADRTPDTLEELNSMTKSVVALAVGIALGEGALPGIDTPLTGLLPEAREPSLDARVHRLTLAHLLSMTAGFAWNPADIDDCVLGACERFADAGERVRFILARPFAHEPGERFVYDSHAVHLLSVLLERATGRTLEDYVAAKLFAPLGIEQWEWIADESGHTFAARGLMLRTRDLLKLGVLMHDRGRPLIDARFIDDATRARIEGGPPHADAAYGYLWWIAPESRYVFAAGFGEQFLFIAPEQRLVVAATSDADETHKGVRDWFEQHLSAC